MKSAKTAGMVRAERKLARAVAEFSVVATLLGRGNASERDIWAALRQVCDEEIKKLDEGGAA